MSKNLLYRLFGLRKVPAELRTRFEQEGILFDEEGTSCALSYRKFRGTHRRSGRGYQSGVAGTLVITQESMFVSLPYMIHFDHPIETAAANIRLTNVDSDSLTTQFNVEALFAKSSGGLSVRWRTGRARAIADHLLARGATRG